MRWLILPLLLWPLAAGAVVYKWTDSQGVIHFSDEPPANRKAQRVTPGEDGGSYTFNLSKPRKGAGRPNPKAVETFTQERPDPTTAASLEPGSDARLRSCKDARLRLNQMAISRVAYESDARGRQRLLAGEDKAIAERALAGEVEFWCNGSL